MKKNIFEAELYKNKNLLHYLETFITEPRLQKFSDIINQRTRYLSMVMEHPTDDHNVSAVLRSCECFGVQNVHIIEGNDRYKSSFEKEISASANENKKKFRTTRSISKGAHKWLDVKKYSYSENNSSEVFDNLENAGYTLVAAGTEKPGMPADKIPVDKPIAIIMGKERTGLSEVAIHRAKYFMTIPMYGFTESFNVSVAASLILYSLASRIRKEIEHWQLTEIEKEKIYFDWVMHDVKKHELVVEEWLRKNS